MVEWIIVALFLLLIGIFAASWFDSRRVDAELSDLIHEIRSELQCLKRNLATKASCENRDKDQTKPV